ncbi:MAG TPA: ABC transporter permease [Actinomycetota bacterium]|nr:ABC transporter permease [Actinomycetota bacterium]
MEVTASRGGRRALVAFFAALVLFLYAPLAILTLFSFNDNRFVVFPFEGFTLRWYEAFLGNSDLIEALKTSAIVAAISSVLAVALGVVASYVVVRRRFRGKGAVTGLLLAPLVIPYLVFGISLLVLFRAVDDLLTDALGIYFGLGVHSIVIGHVVVSLPYAILTIVPRLERVSVSLEEAARDLGASSLHTFRRVTLPLLTPAVVSAYLIAFTLSFDEYAIASFVAGREATYPIFLYSSLRTRAALPQMIAVSVIVLFLSLVLVVGTEVGRWRYERRLEFAPGA